MPTPKPPQKPTKKLNLQTVKTTSFRFVRTGLIVAIAFILFQWAGSKYKIDSKLKSVNIEVWIGLVITITTTYWEWYAENQKEKVKQTQENQVLNSELIKRLEGRIDSLMMQLAQVRAAQSDNSGVIQTLQTQERALDDKIDAYRYQVLEERFKLLSGFNEEICKLHTDVAYIKGHRDGDRIFSERLQDILKEVATQLSQAQLQPSISTIEDNTNDLNT